MSKRTVVRLENITKRFGNVTAVENLSIQVKEGDFFSFLGPSGCGKTTALRLIAGFESLTSGSIYLQENDITAVPPNNRDTGMVFQGYALFPHKTVAENVGFGLKMQGVKKNEREKQVSEMLEVVDLPGLESRSPQELSGGQQQRVALARALVIEPSVLLLDEPLSNLDLKLREQMRIELKRIHRELNITTIYVTHDQEEALSMSDRILVMNQGNAQQVGSPAEIYEQPNNRFVADFIGKANLIKADVSSIRNGNLTLSPHSNHYPKVDVSENGFVASGISVGEPITLNIRPENIEIEKHSPELSGTVDGHIREKTFLGKDTTYIIDVGDKEKLNVNTSGSRMHKDLEVGDKVILSWTGDDCAIVKREQ